MRTWWLAVANVQQLLYLIQAQPAPSHRQECTSHVADLLVQKAGPLNLHSPSNARVRKPLLLELDQHAGLPMPTRLAVQAPKV